MKKFTIFTVLLTVVVVVMVAETVVNRYLPTFDNGEENLSLSLPKDLDLSKITETNVLGADLEVPAVEETVVTEDPENVLRNDPDGASSEELDVVDPEIVTLPTPKESTLDVPDFENPDFVATPTETSTPNVFISQEQVKAAGFTTEAYLQDEEFDGFLFKSIQVGDLFDVSVQETLIRSKDALFAKVYVFKMGPNSGATDVYKVLKTRATDVKGSSVNETNDFGAGSFYFNDTERTSTAFLVVRINNYIYAFSYPKNFQPQIKNLLKLIQWEFR
ncbi:MAG: hypothetical protein WC873_04840 [Candidatus Gracilibacteria bacterium]